MQKKIQPTDLEEISAELGEIQNLVSLLDGYLCSAPNTHGTAGREYENRKTAYAYNAPVYLTVAACIGERLHGLQESIEATLQEGDTK